MKHRKMTGILCSCLHKKQIVEKLLDNFPNLLHSENTGVKKDSAKKKK